MLDVRCPMSDVRCLMFDVGFINQIIDFRISMFPNEINVFFWLQLVNKVYLYGCDLEY